VTEEVIKAVLLLFPGFIAFYFEQALLGANKKRSDLERIIIAVIYNIPAFVITWAILANIFNINIEGLTKFKTQLQSFQFIKDYVLASFISGLLLGFITSLFKRYLYNIVVSLSRKPLGLPEICHSPWDECFVNKEEPIVELTTLNGEKVKGLLREFTFSDDGEKEITVDNFDLVDKWNPYLTKVEKIYFDIKSGTMVKLFDKEEVLQAIKNNN